MVGHTILSNTKIILYLMGICTPGTYPLHIYMVLLFLDFMLVVLGLTCLELVPNWFSAAHMRMPARIGFCLVIGRNEREKLSSSKGYHEHILSILN